MQGVKTGLGKKKKTGKEMNVSKNRFSTIRVAADGERATEEKN